MTTLKVVFMIRESYPEKHRYIYIMCMVTNLVIIKSTVIMINLKNLIHFLHRNYEFGNRSKSQN